VKFKLIAEAYEILSEDETRQEYNDKLSLGHKHDPWKINSFSSTGFNFSDPHDVFRQAFKLCTDFQRVRIEVRVN
jgi:DnaJ-class molecular chaperone